MKIIKYYTDDYDWVITRCPYDTSTSAAHFDNKMQYVGSGACENCRGFISKDEREVKCKYDEIKLSSAASF